MSVTILAVLFMILVLAIAAFGFRLVIKRRKPPEDLNKETCSLCRQQFLKTTLVERQIGDYRMFYFCAACISALHTELTKKN